MGKLSPAVELEARANREHLKLLKSQDELKMIASIIKHANLPTDVKIRLYAALNAENETLENEQNRVAGLRKAAELSRSKIWVKAAEQ